MAHKVVAAYATLRVPNNLGQAVLTGFYEGALLPPGVNSDDLARHIRKGMVKEVEDAPAPELAPEQPSAPGKNDSREKWADYARGKGAPDIELVPANEGGLTRDALRDKYGA